MCDGVNLGGVIFTVSSLLGRTLLSTGGFCWQQKYLAEEDLSFIAQLQTFKLKGWASRPNSKKQKEQDHSDGAELTSAPELTLDTEELELLFPQYFDRHGSNPTHNAYLAIADLPANP